MKEKQKCRKNSIIAALTFFTLFINAGTAAQSLYDSYSGFAVPVQAFLPEKEVHPALWFSERQINDLRNKKDADAYALSIWNSIITDINSFKTKTASTQDFNDRPRMAKYCAFAWIMTGDTLSRRKAIDALLLAWDNVPRTANKSDFDGDYDEIYRATWLQNYCAAYDWVFDQLTEAQNTAIRNKIAEEILLLKNNMIQGAGYASSRPHNHRSKPAWAIGSGALTLSADPRAASWLTFSLQQANTVTRYQFSGDGLYREGSHYLLYSAVNFIPFLWHYKNVSGQDHFPYYKSHLEMALKIRNARGLLPNIEDSYYKPYPTHMMAAAYKNTPTELHPSEPLSSLLQWNWFTTYVFTKDYTGATTDICWNIDEYLTYDPAINKNSGPAVPATLKTRAGAVIFRDSQNSVKENKRYLYFNGVPESDNHQHPDILSYVLEYDNTLMACDAGYGQNDPAGTTFYKAPYAHNNVTINDRGINDIPSNTAPADLHFITSPVYDFSEKKDSLIYYKGNIRRGIAFPDKKYWVVYDIMSASQEADYKLYIHSRGAFSRTGNKLTWTTAADQWGQPEKLFSYILASEPCVFRDTTGKLSLFKDFLTQNYTEAGQRKDKASFIHLLYPDAASATYPDITDLSQTGVPAFQIKSRDGNQNDIFILQQQHETRNIQNVATDALFSWSAVSAAGNNLLKFAVTEATAYSFSSKEILRTDYPVTMCADLAEINVNRFYIDSLPAAVSFSFASQKTGGGIKTVTLNGKPVNYILNENTLSFSLSEGGKLEITYLLTSVETGESKLIPESFNVRSFPNPFNPLTTIEYSIPAASIIDISIYNLLGQKVESMPGEIKPAGTHRFSWNASGLPSGVYVCRLGADSGNKNYFRINKLILAK
ncbi:MAG: heparinase II/III family protein [Syntrophothermus sp.]